MRKLSILLIALAFAACVPNNLPSSEPAGSAGSVGVQAQALDQSFTVVNSNGGARFVMSNNDGIVQSGVRLHAMGFPSCTYQCNYAGNGHQTFCKSNNVGLCPSIYSDAQSPSQPYLFSVKTTTGADINHTLPPAVTVFIGNTDDSGMISGHRYHHVYTPQTGQCGGTADGDVLNPNMLPNNNIWTIHCP